MSLPAWGRKRNPQMNCLLLDTETTGLDSTKDRIIEMGWMFTDSMFTPLAPGESHLMRDESYPDVSEEITKLTGISQVMLLEQGKSPTAVFSFLKEQLDIHKPEVIVAYNAQFDAGMVLAELKRGEYEASGELQRLTFACAMVDVESNYAYKCWKLSHLALDKGVAIDPSKLHRASDDVELMRKMLVQTGTNIQEILEYQREPWIIVRAVTTKPWEDEGKSTNEAKKRGYSWEIAKGDPERKVHTKAWVKRVKERNLAAEEKEAPFPVRIIRD